MLLTSLLFDLKFLFKAIIYPFNIVYLWLKFDELVLILWPLHFLILYFTLRFGYDPLHIFDSVHSEISGNLVKNLLSALLARGLVRDGL